MIVNGYTVTPEVEAACLEAMVGQFQEYELARRVAHDVHDTNLLILTVVAKKLIQRERKAGNIRRVGNRWEMVKP